jgi:hypothetical protein
MCLQRLWSICLLPVVAVVVRLMPVAVERAGFFKDMLALRRGLLTL